MALVLPGDGSFMDLNSRGFDFVGETVQQKQLHLIQFIGVSIFRIDDLLK